MFKTREYKAMTFFNKNSLHRVLFGVVLSLAAVFTQAESHSNGGDFSHAFKSFVSGPSVVGGWHIEQADGQQVLVLNDSFKAKSGPDVKLFLSPTAASKVTGRNATDGSVFLVQLDRFDGNQRFVLPAGTDLSQFKTLVLHCEEYSKLWGTSPLHTSAQ